MPQIPHNETAPPAIAFAETGAGCGGGTRHGGHEHNETLLLDA
jgi:hypothetical protein